MSLFNGINRRGVPYTFYSLMAVFETIFMTTATTSSGPTTVTIPTFPYAISILLTEYVRRGGIPTR